MFQFCSFEYRKKPTTDSLLLTLKFFAAIAAFAEALANRSFTAKKFILGSTYGAEYRADF